MNLNQLPNVVIDFAGGHKFIVAQVSDGIDKKLVVRANQRCDYHRDILRLLRIEASGLDVQCIGGGQIRINPDTKTISIYGDSGDFGLEPDRKNTVEMLKNAMPDYNITARTGW